MYNYELCGKLSVLSGNDPDCWGATAASFHMSEIMGLTECPERVELENMYVDTVKGALDTVRSDPSNSEAHFILLYAMGSDTYSELMDVISSGADVSLNPCRYMDTLMFAIDY